MLKTIRNIIRWAVPVFLMIWLPYRFYWDIDNYYTHFSDYAAGFVIIYGSVFLAVGLIMNIKRRKLFVTLFYSMALVICLFFGYWIFRISFCTECDHLTKSDLGFMLEPYADRFGFLWPD